MTFFAKYYTMQLDLHSQCCFKLVSPLLVMLVSYLLYQGHLFLVLAVRGHFYKQKSPVREQLCWHRLTDGYPNNVHQMYDDKEAGKGGIPQRAEGKNTGDKHVCLFALVE